MKHVIETGSSNHFFQPKWILDKLQWNGILTVLSYGLLFSNKGWFWQSHNAIFWEVWKVGLSLGLDNLTITTPTQLRVIFHYCQLLITKTVGYQIIYYKTNDYQRIFSYKIFKRLRCNKQLYKSSTFWSRTGVIAVEESSLPLENRWRETLKQMKIWLTFRAQIKKLNHFSNFSFTYCRQSQKRW